MSLTRDALLRRVAAELDHAYAKHGREPWGRHEFYAILLEEVEELWDAIKSDASSDDVLNELVQVAAMCFRYWETDDRYRGAHWPPDADHSDDHYTDPRGGEAEAEQRHRQERIQRELKR